MELDYNKTPVRQHQGFLFLLLKWEGLYVHRLVTDYLSPSNHLQMRWQLTPAETAILSGGNIFMELTSLLSPVSEAVIFHIISVPFSGLLLLILVVSEDMSNHRLNAR